MDNDGLFRILDNIKESDTKNFKDSSKHDRVLIIDSLNLFLRNFSMLNYVNPEGVHVGGLGGFLKSLGSLVNTLTPTSVYIVFDGEGSSTNRKNLLPEYKSNRNLNRITNWNTFESFEEELDSKIGQIGRLVHYLRFLPVKIISLSKTEADDVIAYLSTKITNSHTEGKIYIVSRDRDFIQLVNKNIILYDSMSKEFWDEDLVRKFYKINPKNFIIYKTLLGDPSDKIPGVKGLGKKKILSKFPEIQDVELTMDCIYDISSKKYKDHEVYSRIILNIENLKRNYNLMDLKNPMLNDQQIKYLNGYIEEDVPPLDVKNFIGLYNIDQLGGVLRNLDYWLRENFSYLYNFNKN